MTRRYHYPGGYNAATGVGLMITFFILSQFGAWLLHIIYCLVTGSWGFLIAGALLVPIGVIHGWIIFWSWVVGLIGSLFGLLF